MGHLFHKLSPIEFSSLPLKPLDVVMVRGNELDLICFYTDFGWPCEGECCLEIKSNSTDLL